MSAVLVGQFFRADGTLIHIPAKASRKVAVLEVISKEFSTGTKYPEKEVNEKILKFHPDTAAIRRHMIEYKILERDRESNYWLARSI